MATDPLAQYRENEDVYMTIADQLERVRETFMSADRFEQKVMLYDSSVFAVLSVQNSIDILRTAFRGYVNADSWNDVQEVCKGVNYGNNKYSYIKHNVDVVFGPKGDEIIRHLENDNQWTAVAKIVDNLKGVSWIKSAFVPAMLGFTDVMCIDTNVAQKHPSDSVKSNGYNTMSDYKNAVDAITDLYSDLHEDVSTFMLQWVVFDANREDGVARHSEWFEHMLPGTPFGRQMALDAY
jgi:thermostable 8-oxoguanine DNA glycosylase